MVGPGRDKGTIKGSGLPDEEPHDVRKAGGGLRGKSLGGAHTGRSTSRPGADVRKEPKGRTRY